MNNNNENKTKVVIFENSKNPLKRVNESLEDNGKKLYIFEGPCASFSGKNNNNRYYDKDEYLSHFDYLLPQIRQKALAGSLDHPDDDEDEEKDIFTPRMKDLSHLVLDLWYKEETNEVWIKIQLLDTTWGKDAMACADAGMPIYISSRASGYIEDDGRVILDTIHTYDIVYRPGFGNARLNPVLESYDCESFSTAIFECNHRLNNKNHNNMPDNNKNQPKYVTEERLEAVMENLLKGVGKLRRISVVNESEIAGKAVVGGVTSPSSDGKSQTEFVWTLSGNGDRLNLLVCKEDGSYETVLTDAPESIKSTVNSFIASFEQIEGGDDLIKAVQNNFQDNPFFESLDGNKILDAAQLIAMTQEEKEKEQYIAMLVAYLINSQDDLEIKYDLVKDYVNLVFNETLDDYNVANNLIAQDVVNSFIDSNRYYYTVKENRKNCIMEKLNVARKDYNYIKESLTAKKINECDDAIAVVTDFVQCDEKPISQKVDLIAALNDIYNCTYEICDDAEKTIADFVENSDPDCPIEDLNIRLNKEIQDRYESYNIVAKRLNSVMDYLNMVATEVNGLADQIEARFSGMEMKLSKAIEGSAVMEARLNHLTEFCDMIANTVNDLADFSSLTVKRVNTVADYANTIADHVNENFDNHGKKIASITESLGKQAKKQKKVEESLDSRLNKAIESVISKGQNNAPRRVNENASKNRVFEDNGSLRVPVRYQKSWNLLSEEKKNEIICLFEFRKPKSQEEVSAIWESLNLGSHRLITESRKTPNPIAAADRSGLGYEDKDIDNLLGL